MTMTEQTPPRQILTPAHPVPPSPRSPSASVRVRCRRPCPDAENIVSPEALAFVADLQRQFVDRHRELLHHRTQRREQTQSGQRLLEFSDQTRSIREDPTWRVPPPAPGLEDRRCEITGPPDRKMTISALNSGAQVWMADFEDATAPSWANVIGGQRNLYDAIRQQIDYTGANGREYRLTDQTATIVVRPRGWHLDERQLIIDGAPAIAALVDFGLYFFHNATELIKCGAGPYFYLPKLESHTEARLWNDIFDHAERTVGIPRGTIRATCLIETVPAAFEMAEILYELRSHSAGLNAGRWDYIFSMIKTFADDADHVLPDRSDVTMTAPFMRDYTELLVKTCHARGAHAIGGMAAFVPASSNPAATESARRETYADKTREATDGFDGSWVAHPHLVDTCTAAFNATLGAQPHQLDVQRTDVTVSGTDLTDVSNTPGEITLDGIRTNIAVSLEYLTAWLGGRGAVAINHLMEDAATVEISRMQLWQRIRHHITTVDGTPVTRGFVHQQIRSEAANLAQRIPGFTERIGQASMILADSCLNNDWPSFITNAPYRRYLAP